MKKLFTILLIAKIMILTSGQVTASEEYCCVPYDPIIQPITDDLTSNRHSALPEGTLQLTAFYDGNGQADLGVQVKDMATGDIEWIDVQVPPFGIQIPTWEFDLTGHEPTGLFHVGNVVENGVIDGLAFGIFWRDDDANYHHLQSNNAQAEYIATYASAWPLGMNDIVFASRTPQLSDSFGREQARMMLYGAKLLKNGCYKFHIDMNSKLPNRCRITQPYSLQSQMTSLPIAPVAWRMALFRSRHGMTD